MGEGSRGAYLSCAVSRRPILVRKTSGRNQTCSLLRKNSLLASFTMRGYVRRPTHHHDTTNRSFCHTVICVGSIAGAIENKRATIFGWPFEELRVMVLLTRAPPDFAKGSEAESE